MGRLFWKIFLWFWLTLILIAAAVIWGTTLYLHDSDHTHSRQQRSELIRQQADTIKEYLERYGEDDTAEWLSDAIKPRPKYHILVIDEFGFELLDRPFDANSSRLRYQQSAIAPSGEEFQIFSMRTRHARPPPPLKRLLRPLKDRPGIILLWLGIALLMSTLVCFWLAWYLVRPIRSLQQATRKLASGQLETRVSQAIGNRRDEIADLGQDFDRMAQRLQQLLDHQKSLLSDVSHELRSPLARLQVALGLAQKKSTPDMQQELTRIERESLRLEDLVSQVLTLSRLDAGTASSQVYQKDDYLSFAAFLESVVEDCNFEANGNKKSVSLQTLATGTIKANTELLRRALENVIRNAIRHTAEGSSVEVRISSTNEAQQQLRVEILDQGPGVPDEAIDTLFEPFVRLQKARDRESGGYGLGLAIAKRAIEFHHGSITAGNRENGGLRIAIHLPAADVSPTSLTSENDIV